MEKQCNHTEMCFLCTHSMNADLPPNTDRGSPSQVKIIFNGKREARTEWGRLIRDYETGTKEFREGVNSLAMWLAGGTLPVILTEALNETAKD